MTGEHHWLRVKKKSPQSAWVTFMSLFLLHGTTSLNCTKKLFCPENLASFLQILFHDFVTEYQFEHTWLLACSRSHGRVLKYSDRYQWRKSDELGNSLLYKMCHAAKAFMRIALWQYMTTPHPSTHSMQKIWLCAILHRGGLWTRILRSIPPTVAERDWAEIGLIEALGLSHIACGTRQTLGTCNFVWRLVRSA